MIVAVTGGAGYIGVPLVRGLLSGGHEARVLDVFLHGQHDVAEELERDGVTVVEGDIRDAHAREQALRGADAVVHLAAIVGDPACARDPALAEEVNVDASTALIEDAQRHGLNRLVFASTCSNYGRMADPTVPIDESGVLAPVSLYAEQKVQIEKALLSHSANGLSATCIRFATVYGVARRMRFDLTVNEFTRDLWAGRTLEVFGEQFWRPYIHVDDAARAARLVLESAPEQVAGQVFNAGHTDENYRKLDLVEIITGKLDGGDVRFVHRDEDPRDYKVSFERIRNKLGFEPQTRVPEGVDGIIRALEERRFGDPFESGFSNVA